MAMMRTFLPHICQESVFFVEVPEHHETFGEYARVTLQLEAAIDAQEDPVRIAELKDDLTKLEEIISSVAEGARPLASRALA